MLPERMGGFQWRAGTFVESDLLSQYMLGKLARQSQRRNDKFRKTRTTGKTKNLEPT